ncbi:hypothetical protein NCC49_000138 [Naganishia albida]|nr:hypothetical protein NCC49_000138 [Naganishia albida]
MSSPRGKRPHPKLSLSSFFSGGSSSSGARAAPVVTPSQLRPTRVIDAHGEPTAKNPETYDGVPVEHVVVYGSSNSDESPFPMKSSIVFPLDPSTGGVKETVAKLQEDPYAPVEIHIIKHDASGQPHALDANDWQNLEEMVDNLSGKDFDRIIIISGLLPPPLDPSYPSTRLHTALAYAETYLPRLTELSLDRNIFLKLLPPVLSSASIAGSGSEEAKDSRRAANDWWIDEEEIKRVTRLYVTPAMECFGSHRIMFGSSPPHDPATTTSLVPPERWFNIAKTVVSELVCGSGDLQEAQAEMDAVFFKNASRIWAVGQ